MENIIKIEVETIVDEKIEKVYLYYPTAFNTLFSKEHVKLHSDFETFLKKDENPTLERICFFSEEFLKQAISFTNIELDVNQINLSVLEKYALALCIFDKIINIDETEKLKEKMRMKIIEN